MKIKKELIKREIAGDTILVPVGQTVFDSNGLFVLNETGAFLWEQLPQAQDEEALLESLLNAYEVDSDTAKADIRSFLDALRGLDVID